MTPELTVGHVDHQTSVYGYSLTSAVFATDWWGWRCSCGDRQAGYLKQQYAEDEARMHEQRPETPRVPR